MNIHSYFRKNEKNVKHESRRHHSNHFINVTGYHRCAEAHLMLVQRITPAGRGGISSGISVINKEQAFIVLKF